MENYSFFQWKLSAPSQPPIADRPQLLDRSIHQRVKQVLLDAAPEVATLHEFSETHNDEIQAGDHDEHLVAGACAHECVGRNAGQILPGESPRFEGGFGIYDAPEPWGPWTTAYFTERWDVGPGETSSIPPKWISTDGRTAHLVFSGNDAFSVRKMRLILRRPIGAAGLPK